jgi:hypothetical protein
MTLEEKLTEFARSRGTNVYEYPLPQTRSVSAKLGEDCFIGIDSTRLTAPGELAVCLAHELGHCETEAFYSVYSPLLTRDKLERRATVWAIKHTVPKNALDALIESGVAEEWELAEHFGVTVEFMHAAIEYYKNGELYYENK